MNYRVRMDYSEKNGKHTLTETYMCSGVKGLKKTLGNMLDLLIDKNGIPNEPDLEILTRNLRQYITDKDIKVEFRRQQKSYEIFTKLMSDVENSDAPFNYAEEEYDKHTIYSVEAV